MHGHDAVKSGLYTGLFNIPGRADGRPRNFTLYLPLGSTARSLAVGAMSDGQNMPLAKAAPPANASL